MTQRLQVQILLLPKSYLMLRFPKNTRLTGDSKRHFLEIKEQNNIEAVENSLLVEHSSDKKKQISDALDHALETKKSLPLEFDKDGKTLETLIASKNRLKKLIFNNNYEINLIEEKIRTKNSTPGMLSDYTEYCIGSKEDILKGVTEKINEKNKIYLERLGKVEFDLEHLNLFHRNKPKFNLMQGNSKKHPAQILSEHQEELQKSNYPDRKNFVEIDSKLSPVFYTNDGIYFGESMDVDSTNINDKNIPSIITKKIKSKSAVSADTGNSVQKESCAECRNLIKCSSEPLSYTEEPLNPNVIKVEQLKNDLFVCEQLIQSEPDDLNHVMRKTLY